MKTYLAFITRKKRPRAMGNRYFGYLALILVLSSTGCDTGKQVRQPGCVGQTVVRTDRLKGSAIGSVITLDDGNSYKNVDHSHIIANGFPQSFPLGTAVVVCKGNAPGIYDISVDIVGRLYFRFQRLPRK
jgi:hypothetical protein